jgi:hypothetical protein
LWLHLDWVPRDQNQEADALTNHDFSQFSESNRVPVDVANVDWIVMPELMKTGMAFYEELQAIKEGKKRVTLVPAAQTVKAKKRKVTDRLKFRDPW